VRLRGRVEHLQHDPACVDNDARMPRRHVLAIDHYVVTVGAAEVDAARRHDEVAVSSIDETEPHRFLSRGNG
jgi:hypothetical protein